jgi:vitamin B12 transporter
MQIFLALIAILIAASSAAASEAKSAAAETTTKVETVTVIAHRLPTADGVLPVQVRTPDTGPIVGADSLRSLPSLAISQSGNLGSVTQVRIRGAEANHLMVLMDGVELTDPATDSSYNFANLALNGANHVELLAGSHSAIWGSDALAGVLNIVTTPQDRVRTLSFEAGAFDTQHASIHVADHNEDRYFNLSIGHYSTDGTNISEVVGNDGGEKDGFKQSNFLLAGGLTKDVWSVSTMFRHMSAETDFDPTPFPSFQPRDGDNESKHNEDLASLTIDWRGPGRLEQRLQLSYLQTENRSFTDGLRASKTAAERTKATAITRFRPDDKQTFTLLLEYEKEEFRQIGSPSFFGDPNQHQAVETTSLAVEYLAKPLSNLSLTLSARGDDNTDFDDTLSFRAAAKYQLSEDLQIWASWGTGTKNPSFVERFGFTPDTFVGNADLEPETNRHLSTGIRYTSGVWSVAATIFSDRLKDEINGYFFDPGLGAPTAINKLGKSKRDGAEFELSADFPYATFALGVSYLDADEPDGSREIRRPAWQGFVSVRHQSGPVSAEVSAFRIDDQDDFDFSAFPANRVSLHGYTLLRAHVSYRITNHLRLALRGENLLDEHYQDQLGYRSPGRALYFQLGLDF